MEFTLQTCTGHRISNENLVNLREIRQFIGRWDAGSRWQQAMEIENGPVFMGLQGVALHVLKPVFQLGLKSQASKPVMSPYPAALHHAPEAFNFLLFSKMLHAGQS